MQVLKTFPESLGKHIKFFYSILATESECIDSVHRRLPDGTLDIVFNLGSAVQLSRDGVNFQKIPSIALTGLYQDKNFLLYKGDVHLIGAVFQPGSAHLFVNDTLEQFKQCTDNAALIFGNQVYPLLEQIKNISGEKEKHNMLERFLLNYLRKNKDEYNSCKISGAIQQIHALEGNVEMPFLYKTHTMSERNFRRKFNEFVGMSPKQYATIIRIKSFSKRYELSRSPHVNILNELGYTDQSHFSKDFQKIVGTNPIAYFNQLNKMEEKFIHLI